MSYADPYRDLTTDVVQMAGPDERMAGFDVPAAGRMHQLADAAVQGAGRIFSPSVLPQPEDEISRRLNFLHSRGAVTTLERRRRRERDGRDRTLFQRDGRTMRDMDNI